MVALGAKGPMRGRCDSASSLEGDIHQQTANLLSLALPGLQAPITGLSSIYGDVHGMGCSASEPGQLPMKIPSGDSVTGWGLAVSKPEASDLASETKWQRHFLDISGRRSALFSILSNRSAN
jgi:hypothetical protein